MTALKITSDKCLIGADPEFFVRRNGHFVPAHDFNLGTKLSPLKTPNGSVQVDGLAMEVNVKPAETRQQFVKNTMLVMTDLMNLIHMKDPLYTLAAEPCVDIGINKMSSLPPYALELGCERDYNAYSGIPNGRPDMNCTFRTGSGHLHLGWTENQPIINNLRHMVTCRRLTIQLDYFVGLTTLLFDQDNRRRQLYGKAGAHRVKPYGLEYRVPSNKWAQTPQLTGLMFDQAQKAFRAYRAGEDMYKKYGTFAQTAINQGNIVWHKARPDLYAEILGGRT